MFKLIKDVFKRVFQYSRSASSIWIAILLILTSFVIGTVGYWIIEGMSFLDALYFHIITFSTVGYTEIGEPSTAGRMFTALMILLNIGIFAYSVSAFTQLITEGKLFEKLFEIRMEARIDKLNGHVIICGFGRYGKQCMEHFEYIGQEYVIIDNNEKSMAAFIETKRKFKYIIGDATEDETLIVAGIEKAKALICALPDDTGNLFTVLSAKQINPELTIVSRVNDQRTEKKLLMAGANHVIMPERIGGFYMATMLDKPGSIEFFSHLSREAEADVDFEEINFEDLKEEFQNKSLRELEMRKLTGANVLSIRNEDGRMEVNPDPDVKFVKGRIFIVLGTKEQIKRIKTQYFRDQ